MLNFNQPKPMEVSAMLRFRFWLAGLICPELCNQEEFYFQELQAVKADLEYAEKQKTYEVMLADGYSVDEAIAQSGI
jgi:hypothetical protein